MNSSANDFDIVVIGGGHAGAEAARAAALLGAQTCLLTLDRKTIAQMSCNPAVGGIGKRQIVREIDALGGLMGLAADATGIQFRMLNRSKGPAVWGPRCQSDRHAYARWVQAALGEISNLTIIEGEATEIITDDDQVIGIRAVPGRSGQGRAPAGMVIHCRASVVTAGTFLNGLVHLGPKMWSAGRYDEPSADKLSDSLRALGLTLSRLKTGTCPRLASETIDYAKCIAQHGDTPPMPFSFLNDSLSVDQLPCYITHTTERVHSKVKDNLDRAPMYTGQIQSEGPRYCPSFETKIVRFPDKTSHQIFLEPEGRDTNWVYVNGISTSLPGDVQEFMVHNIPGLEHAEILQLGYAIEYDFAPPTQLTATLQTKTTKGLYLAGQINGTTGYEEASALGLMAGINAALQLAGGEPFVLRRDQAYIGVMIDDLVTKGIVEPYRMFTSRAEHRLSLRADNADRRLTPLGRELGLVNDARWEAYAAGQSAVAQARQLLDATRIEGKSLWQLIRRPGSSLDSTIAHAPPPVAEQLSQLLTAHGPAVRSLATDSLYEGYLAKESAAMGNTQQLDKKLIPQDLDYPSLTQLRHEARQKLGEIRPRSLGQALRVSGITPADITVLAVHIAGRTR